MKYRLAKRGVVDTDTGEVVLPGTSGWTLYQSWLQNNSPDPMEPDPPTLIDTRRDLVRTRLLAKERNSLFSISITIGGFNFIFSQADMMLIQFVALSVLAGNPLPAGFGWRDVDGNFHSVTQVQLANVLQRIANSGFDLRQFRWTKQDEIETSDDPESVDLGS